MTAEIKEAAPEFTPVQLIITIEFQNELDMIHDIFHPDTEFEKHGASKCPISFLHRGGKAARANVFDSVRKFYPAF